MDSEQAGPNGDDDIVAMFNTTMYEGFFMRTCNSIIL